MQDLIALARNVEKARADLDRAIEALRAATGLSSSSRPKARRLGLSAPSAANGNAGSVSASVLAAIQSSATGASRAELSGLGNPGAIHSALKVHKAAGRIVNKDGRWVTKGGGGQAQGKKKGPEPQ